jgi:hypothetical protein
VDCPCACSADRSGSGPFGRLVLMPVLHILPALLVLVSAHRGTPCISLDASAARISRERLPDLQTHITPGSFVKASDPRCTSNANWTVATRSLLSVDEHLPPRGTSLRVCRPMSNIIASKPRRQMNFITLRFTSVCRS